MAQPAEEVAMTTSSRLTGAAAAVGVVLVGLVAIGAAAGVGGFIPLDRDAHPPCDQLPRFTEATAALATHAGLAAEIERLGERVAVGAGQPCPGDASRGLVVVTYGSRAERDAV